MSSQYIDDGGMWLIRVCTRCYRVLHGSHDIRCCTDCNNPEYMLCEAHWRPHPIGGQRWTDAESLEAALLERGA